jgi:hypothetical protein
MQHVTLRIVLTLIGSLTFAGHAWAGMPSVDITDAARMRLDTLSFFLVAYLLIALILMWLWNSLRPSFPSLPRLNYWRALGLLTIWALFFVVVLTMISGARELLTPGAWERNGATYQLTAPKAGERKP